MNLERIFSFAVIGVLIFLLLQKTCNTRHLINLEDCPSIDTTIIVEKVEPETLLITDQVIRNIKIKELVEDSARLNQLQAWLEQSRDANENNLSRINDLQNSISSKDNEIEKLNQQIQLYEIDTTIEHEKYVLRANTLAAGPILSQTFDVQPITTIIEKPVIKQVPSKPHLDIGLGAGLAEYQTIENDTVGTGLRPVLALQVGNGWLSGQIGWQLKTPIDRHRFNAMVIIRKNFFRRSSFKKKGDFN